MSTAPAFSPGPCSTRLPVVGSVLQVHARALVAAVLRPHHGKDAELGEGRLAAEHLEDALIFVARQAVLLEELAAKQSSRGGERSLE